MNQPAHNTQWVNRTQTRRFYTFVSTGKERDEETGYGYFGARYMDHELMTMWLSVDPLADKYPNISPYAYCAWNPVKLIDPDGKEFDLSSLTEEQRKEWTTTMEKMCENSKLFNLVYTSLSESETIYHIKIGKTKDNVAGQYNPSDNSITFRDSKSMCSFGAYCEEMFHAIQFTENADCYSSSLDFNYEFEAKIAKNIISEDALYNGCYEALVGSQDVNVSDYVMYLSNKYNNGGINSSIFNDAFISDYVNRANNYATGNSQNGFDENYCKMTKQSPQSLMWLINNANQ